MSEAINIGDRVLYKNNQLIAVDKPSGMPAQSDKTGDLPLVNIVSSYCKHEVFLIHRIDRPASGVVLFAKNKKAVAHLNDQFQKGEISKTYLAIVKNPPAEPSGTLTHFLSKNGKTNKSVASDKETKNSKKAICEYKTIAQSEQYHLLQINLKTGRHHQIRAQLAAIGCPIKGDNKYGFKRGNKDRSINLHAWKLGFKHPVSKEEIELVADLPKGDSLWEFFDEKLESTNS